MKKPANSEQPIANRVRLRRSRLSFAASAFRLLPLFVALLVCVPAHAHIGSKDVFETITAGPYKLFITVRMPSVIPGVATIEVQSTGAPIDAIQITPTPLTGEASLHPPTPDPMKRALGPDGGGDPNTFTGALWIMASGSWEVRFNITGHAGTYNAAVPIPAVPLTVLRMQKSLGILLAVLGLILMLGFAGAISAAVRESRLAPGQAPSPARRNRARIAFLAGLTVAIIAVYAGGHWWNVEAADYTDAIYRPSLLRPTLTGNQLTLDLGRLDTDDKTWKPLKTGTLLLDHGKITHLYAIRWPEMDAVFHLHPHEIAKGRLAETLPTMPPGDYRLFADIVLPTGFPETLTAPLAIPPGMPAAPLAADDASAFPPALLWVRDNQKSSPDVTSVAVRGGLLVPDYKLPDGYTMHWQAPTDLTAAKAYALQFTLLDPTGKPATDVQPYLGMAGHAAFVKTDGTVFAHTHPDGSAAMPAMMLANHKSEEPMSREASVPGMPGMVMYDAPLPATVGFPYGFPTPGRYRIFIQMKHGTVVETGVFDAGVK